MWVTPNFYSATITSLEKCPTAIFRGLLAVKGKFDAELSDQGEIISKPVELDDFVVVDAEVEILLHLNRIAGWVDAEMDWLISWGPPSISS